MNVAQVIEQAKEWVEVHGSQMPGFCGAHMMGSLNHMRPDAPFPAYRDVDLNIVLKDAPESPPLDVPYKGLILECGRLGLERYKSPEAVLSDPQLASNLAAQSILSDPVGLLTELHTAVVRDYARRKWVTARCEVEKMQARRGLMGIREAGSPVQAVFSLVGELVIGLTGLIAVASLEPPTHRRSLIRTKKLLEKSSNAGLQQRMLELLGFVHMDRDRVEAFLTDAAGAFDRAVAVITTPVPFSFKLHKHVRPYFIQGAQEMIDEGFPREAMLWIWGCLAIANGAIQADAHPEERPYFQAKLDYLLVEMGWGTMDEVASRRQQAQALTEKAFEVTDKLLRLNPAIED